MTLTLNNTNTVSANNIVVNGTDISSLYATVTYVDNEIANINVGSGGGGGITQQDLDDAVNPVIAVNDDQNLVITDINNNLANNFQTTAQLNTNLYNKTQVDSAITVIDIKALDNFKSKNTINTNLTNNYQTNSQLATNFYNKTEIDANNWIDNSALAPYALTCTLTNDYLTSTQIGTSYYNKSEINANNWVDNTALAPYATTATLTTNYQTNSQLATSYYNKTEVDGLIAGAGGGVNNPVELVDANTSIERYTNATKSNISLDLLINETASAIRLNNGNNNDTDIYTYIEYNNITNGTLFYKQVFF